MSQNFRLFHVSNLSVRNFRIFCSCIRGQCGRGAPLGHPYLQVKPAMCLPRPDQTGQNRSAEMSFNRSPEAGPRRGAGAQWTHRIDDWRVRSSQDRYKRYKPINKERLLYTRYIYHTSELRQTASARKKHTATQAESRRDVDLKKD